MSRTADRATQRQRRHRRVRRKVVGLPERPRLNVFRSLQHLHVQVIDDVAGRTVLGCSTQDDQLRLSAQQRGAIAGATALGALVAQKAKAQGIQRVVFDRGGYPYHGRVKALADAVRAGGIEV